MTQARHQKLQVLKRDLKRRGQKSIAGCAPQSQMRGLFTELYGTAQRGRSANFGGYRAAPLGTPRRDGAVRGPGKRFESMPAPPTLTPRRDGAGRGPGKRFESTPARPTLTPRRDGAGRRPGKRFESTPAPPTLTPRRDGAVRGPGKRFESMPDRRSHLAATEPAAGRGKRRRALLPGLLHGLDQLRHHLEQIAHNAVIGHFENGRVGVFVDSHHGARSLHAHQVLDGAGNAQGQV